MQTDSLEFQEAVVVPRDAFERFDGLTVVERPGWLQLIAPAFRQGGLNGVACAQLSDAEADAVIDETVATYQRLGVRWRWTVSPESTPLDLAERLERRGLMREVVRAMVRETAREAWPEAPGVTVEVADASTVELHARTMAAGWQMDVGPIRDFNRLLLSAPSRRHALFLARVDGEPAASAGLTLFERSAYLVGAVVLPAFRRRGVYRALTAARLDFARARGIALATSQAKVATSAPLLETLGFRAVCEFPVLHGTPRSCGDDAWGWTGQGTTPTE
ncbi:MAG: GNAT family N-acetyltransferase [Myxococcota bacterium]